MLPEKVGQSSPKFFRGCYPLRPPILPNFIEIGQTSLEKRVGRKRISTHTDIHTHGILTTWVVLHSMQEARVKIEDRGLTYRVTAPTCAEFRHCCWYWPCHAACVAVLSCSWWCDDINITVVNQCSSVRNRWAMTCDLDFPSTMS